MALVLLYAFTAVSILGFGVFGIHPERLAGLSPTAISIYSGSFRFFAIGQVALAGAVIIQFLVRHARLKWVAAFVALYAISLASELLGTTYGIPFGAYSYSAVLKPMWLGRVPVGIPLSWFYMALPSYAIASRILRSRESDFTFARIIIGSLLLLTWDLALDPAMSSATKYWVWGETGAYYGMPLLNLFGWYVTGLVLMTALAALNRDEWIAQLPVRWLAAFYGANLLLALGISAAAGLWLAVAFTIVVLSIIIAVSRVLAARLPALGRPDPFLRLG
jgi:putative membrane protein